MIGSTGLKVHIHGKGFYKKMDRSEFPSKDKFIKQYSISQVVLDNPSDLDWAQEVHGIPESTNFAIMYSNEDAPIKIECWDNMNPDHDEPADHVLEFPGPNI